MNTVVCVLKSGLWKPWAHKDYTVEYGPQHVQWLRDQFATQVKTPHRFVCMSDMDVPGVEIVPLLDNLPGWWSKMELFRQFKKAAYVDLSTVILGDVGPELFNGHRFTMSWHMTRRHGVNSGVMSWDGDYSFLYRDFIKNKTEIMAHYTKARQWGDQDFIKEQINLRGKVAKFQDRFPSLILSYKYDIRERGGSVAVGTRRRVRLVGEWWKQPHIVKFHGKPKPWATPEPWIPKLCAA